MKPKSVLTTLAVILFEGVAVSAAPTAQAGQCSLAGVAGKWAHTYTGTPILPTGAVPLAAVGTRAIDTQGNFSGIQTSGVGADSAEETIQGTMAVHPDCTGTLTVDVSRHSVLALVYDRNKDSFDSFSNQLCCPVKRTSL